MAYMHDRVLDNGINIIDAECNRIDICSQAPTTYAEATSTYSLGNKLTPTISAPGDRVGGGRKVTISAITDGEVTATDTATHFALVDTGNSRLLAVQELDSSQAVTDGNTFSLTAFDIGIPDVA